MQKKHKVYFIYLVLFFDSIKIKNPSLIFKKVHLGGVVNNESSKDIKIFQWRIASTIKSGEMSRKLNIKDVDGILINQPMMYKNKYYTSGIFKFCDLTKVTIVEQDGILELKPSISHFFCSKIGNYGWLKNINEAFPYKGEID